MRSLANADLSSLAALAQTREGDLRPVLLQAQTDLFVSGRRDREAVTTYEALALGLIPLVQPTILHSIAATLAPLAEAPPRVLEALARRLSPSRDLPGIVNVDGALAQDDDLALARNAGIVLDGHRLGELVDCARTQPALARALLARPEPTIFDRAALYQFATRQQRASIRDELARRLPSGSIPRLALSPATRDDLLAAADGPRTAIALAELGIGPTPESAAKGLVGQEVEQELFALALVALGLAPEECIGLFMTLDRSIAHSVEPILHLARIVRSTGPTVATYLATAEGGHGARAQTQHRSSEATGYGSHRPSSRVAHPVSEAKPRFGAQRRHG